jgi:hypothetical protein
MTLALKIYPPTTKPKRMSTVMILLKETGGWHHGYCNQNGALMAAHISGTALAWHYCLTLDEINHVTKGNSGSDVPDLRFLVPPSTCPPPSDCLEMFATNPKDTRRVRRIPRDDSQNPPTQADETLKSALS